MWPVIVSLLIVGLGTLALIGLLALVKELFCDSPFDANVTDAGTTSRQRVGGRASARRCVVMR
jgi:hypothetical protein